MLVVWLVACELLGLVPQPVPIEVIRRVRPEPGVQPPWDPAALCSVSPLQDRVRRKEPDKEGWRRIRGDLDGRRGADTMLVLQEKGKHTQATYFELTLSGRSKLKFSVIFQLGEIVRTVPFPPDATEAELLVIEGVLFGRLCDRIDPSLQLLLDGQVRWVEGDLVIPPAYAVREEGQWRSYVGDAHESKGSLPVTYPRPLTEQGDLKIMSTAHGVVAMRAGMHAWLFVSRDHAKLRWPSELSARVLENGRVVEIMRHPTTMDEILGPIQVIQPL